MPGFIAKKLCPQVGVHAQFNMRQHSICSACTAPTMFMTWMSHQPTTTPLSTDEQIGCRCWPMTGPCRELVC